MKKIKKNKTFNAAKSITSKNKLEKHGKGEPLYRAGNTPAR